MGFVCAPQEASGCGQMAGFKCFTRCMQNALQRPQTGLCMSTHLTSTHISSLFSLSARRPQSWLHDHKVKYTLTLQDLCIFKMHIQSTLLSTASETLILKLKTRTVCLRKFSLWMKHRESKGVHSWTLESTEQMCRPPCFLSPTWYRVHGYCTYYSQEYRLSGLLKRMRGGKVKRMFGLRIERRNN